MLPHRLKILGLIILTGLTSCVNKMYVNAVDADFIEVKNPDSTQMDLGLKTLLKPYRDSVSKTMDEVIGFSLRPIEKKKPESPLGNFVSDVCKGVIDSVLLSNGQKPSDLFVFNLGGLRGSFPAGEIKLRDVYQVMPFDNELVWVDIPIDSLLSLLVYIRDKGGIPISGARMTLSGSSGNEFTFNNGARLEPDSLFRIGTNDFLALGGDGMIMLNIHEKINSTRIRVKNAILNHIRTMSAKGVSIEALEDGRIIP